MNTITTPDVNIDRVRRTLRKAGVGGSSKHAAAPGVVRGGHGFPGGYTTVTKAGITLKRETDYQRKQHVPTGRVLVDADVPHRHQGDPSAERAKLIAEATEALRAAGYTVIDPEHNRRAAVVIAEPGQEV